MTLFGRQIRDVNTDIAELERDSVEALADVKKAARHLRDNMFEPVQKEGDSREERLNLDRLYRESIHVNAECYMHCRLWIAKYKQMIRELESKSVELEEGLRRAIRG
jgi:hypothetical protein